MHRLIGILPRAPDFSECKKSTIQRTAHRPIPKLRRTSQRTYLDDFISISSSIVSINVKSFVELFAVTTIPSIDSSSNSWSRSTLHEASLYSLQLNFDSFDSSSDDEDSKSGNSHLLTLFQYSFTDDIPWNPSPFFSIPRKPSNSFTCYLKNPYYYYFFFDRSKVSKIIIIISFYCS